ncbi:uncharacterized Rho GTPase-activating protein At5g61530-like isoform X1 [Spinacia oleracea]|uniref:Uncharacterized Rho GTPase-activating protein At5g61530-like isoform X1 n=1 Tax=Spinacia oleracea TaxID=3562 RepID=A0ABM3R271_SPIOL|nr:uncharacterized Rho GTPase-activating protein At5g61530-like isoform X1 [Spinacia oleracea]XP_056689719.1 uncharacterized Rho GTPase-activating protein At5g61530-like isoform X1 [Spinacia oleracea]XP_056691360.1 uncharacterized Rho GTPase-activating protein At5g61530-like isoform X1 [Spinacia oleracea]XP_056691361.1 uncharacterized Rho GTPase-activating protein At5g61530-like isoform X1 [Spinacia oleracea]XP_056692889.1 uncharacterized Rho GTPase-activating protein At5g61530-like isoform X1 
MPSMISPQWQDKASGFFSASGVKLKEAGNQAGTFAKDAKENVVDAAERVGSVFKSKWSLFQQPSTKHAVQERFLSAAASTSFLVRKGISETKEKVSVGKIKVEEVAKKTAQRSKSFISDIERWQKGVASSDGLHSEDCALCEEFDVVREQWAKFFTNKYLLLALARLIELV